MLWRGGRAVEGAALEMLFRGNSNEGSNPSLSASFLTRRVLSARLSAFLLTRSLAMAARIGPLATTNCEPRQARKGAAAAVASGAGVRLVGAAAISTSSVVGGSGRAFVLNGRNAT